MKQARSKAKRVLPGNLAQKGLLIVGLPIALELAFLGAITLENRSLEALARNELHYRMLLAECAMLSFSSVDVYKHLEVALNTQNVQELDTVKDDLSNLDRMLDRIQNEAQSDPSARHASAELIATARRMSATFNRARTLLSKRLDIESACEFFELRDGFIEIVPHFVKQQEELCRQAMSLTSTTGKEELRSREREQLAILGAALTGAALAVWVGIIFSREIRSRLAVIQSNTKQLENNLELHQPVGGEDEIHELDESFRSMAAALKEAKNRQRDLYAMIAHDVRSPLLDATLTVDMALTKSGLPAETTASLKRTNRSIARVTELISDLLDIEKLASGRFDILSQRLMSDELVAQSVDSAQGLIGDKNLTVTTACCTTAFMGDRDLLQRVLTNFLSNAIKFSTAGATISVTVQELGGYIEFSVSDEGPGVTDEDKERIFEAFAQTDAGRGTKERSSGLGLAICKMIVQEHDGKIGCDSKPGTGSRFWFAIPAIRTGP